MHILLETFEPNPNGFRFDTIQKTVSFAAHTLPPIVVALAARRLTTTALIAALHTLSPLALLGNMRDPSSDLNFAAFLWWLPLPAIALVIVLIEFRVTNKGVSEPPA